MKYLLKYKIWWVALLAGAIISAIMVNWWPGSDYDAFMRYAPMAEEFASGNFREAFHPRYCVLFNLLTGALAWFTGLSGFAACQIVAVFGWSLSMIPIWYIAKRYLGEETAWWSVVVLLFVPEYAQYAGDGMRDNLRILSYVLCAYGFVAQPIWVGVGVFISVTLRVDGILIGMAIFALYAIICFYRGRSKKMIGPAVWLMAGLLLDSLMVYLFSGYFVPNSHFIKYVSGGVL